MKFNKLNTVILLGFIAIVGVLIMQLLMLNKASSFEKKEIEDKLHYALQDVVTKIYSENNIVEPAESPIQKISETYYVVNVNTQFSSKSLEHYLVTEFEKVKLDMDFEYAVYDCSSDNMLYGKYISKDGNSKEQCLDCFEKDQDLTYYFALRLPSFKSAVYSSLAQYWMYTFVLFFVLVIYVYSIFFMLKQKRYTDLQNDFINNMTHEFKTPLSSILIASKYMSKQPEIKQDKKLSRYMDIVFNQSEKLNLHIEKLLYVAKATSHQFTLSKSSFNLYDVLLSAKENISLKYQDIQPKIEIKAVNVIIEADEFHFYNVLYNLLDNAVKYSMPNPEIIVLLGQKTDFYELAISDNGKGIPEKDMPFIFDSFYRVEQEKGKDIEGFGIGLSYVKKIIDMHLFKIKANNTSSGFKVTLTLPKK